MDKLHDVMRNLQGTRNGERKSESAKADHLIVFRDFIAHLDRMSRPPSQPARAKASRPVKRRTKR